MDEFEIELRLIEEDGLKDRELRREYEQKVSRLRELPPRLAAEGRNEEQIARIMHNERRELGRLYKLAAPPLFREYIRRDRRKVRRSAGAKLRRIA